MSRSAFILANIAPLTFISTCASSHLIVEENESIALSSISLFSIPLSITVLTVVPKSEAILT